MLGSVILLIMIIDMLVESFLVGIGNIDVLMFNIVFVSLLLVISLFEEVLILVEEEGDRMKVVDNEDGVDERLGCVICYESLFLIFGFISLLESYVSVY